eukprot:CAMPEP_0177670866 /NCGR_PEP_ID=MMETSP0447-20121125/24341_1 /TAXON_ID=0 /ORGANISM="Stygamoeba regulata, Strain BSH-02190019" /LENGTH=83 /DNA_ID=CAMNT_0019178105 /DNA_START=34 /DNA_END=282 /DNA_ORIENTATION=+
MSARASPENEQESPPKLADLVKSIQECNRQLQARGVSRASNIVLLKALNRTPVAGNNVPTAFGTACRLKCLSPTVLARLSEDG